MKTLFSTLICLLILGNQAEADSGTKTKDVCASDSAAVHAGGKKISRGGKAICDSKQEPTSTLVFVNKLIKNHKVWIPEKHELKAGEKISVVLKNELNAAHGFEWVGLGIKHVVLPLASKQFVITVPTDASELIYKCHLHPTHVGGVIKINKVKSQKK